LNADLKRWRASDEVRRSWCPADWWTYVQMIDGPHERRTELVAGQTPRARAAWTAHHYVEELLASGGPPAALVILALVLEGPPSDVFEEIAAEPLTQLIGRHGQALVLEVMALVNQDSAPARLRAVAWLDDIHLEESSKARLGQWLRRHGRPAPLPSRQKQRDAWGY